MICSNLEYILYPGWSNRALMLPTMRSNDRILYYHHRLGHFPCWGITGLSTLMSPTILVIFPKTVGTSHRILETVLYTESYLLLCALQQLTFYKTAVPCTSGQYASTIAWPNSFQRISQRTSCKLTHPEFASSSLAPSQYQVLLAKALGRHCSCQ